MMKLIKKMFAIRCGADGSQRNNYSLTSAREFTIKNGFGLDSNLVENDFGKALNEIIDVITNDGLSAQFGGYYRNGYTNLPARFGGDCGNIHLLLIKYIKQNHPEICANLTIGEVNIEGKPYFTFDERKCTEWINGNKPEILDCHVWITLGEDLILDATIGTYINTRVCNSNTLGGVVYGRPSALEVVEINGIAHEPPRNINLLVYSPVILGEAAFNKIAPGVSAS